MEENFLNKDFFKVKINFYIKSNLEMTLLLTSSY